MSSRSPKPPKPAPPVTLTTENAGTLAFELTDRVARTERGKTTELLLADVARVHVSRLAGMSLVELTARNGRKLLVLSDRKPTAEGAARFRAFVEELHARLLATAATAGTSIEFVGGLKIAPAMLIGAAVGTIVLALMNPLHWEAGRIEIALGAAIVAVALGAVLALRKRKRLYDPKAIPKQLLP